MAPPISSSKSARRTRRSCEACRSRKIKCSGDKKGCWHCAALKIECHYSDNKREAEKRAYANACHKVDFYEQFIQKICDALLINEQDLVQLVNHGGATEHPKGKAAVVCGGGEQNIPSMISPNSSPASLAEMSPSAVPREQRTSTISAEPLSTAKLEQHLFDQEYYASQLANTMSPASKLERFNSNEAYEDPALSQDPQLCIRPATNALLKVYVTRIHPILPMLEVSVLLDQYRFYLHNPSVHPGQQSAVIYNYVFAIAVLHLKMHESRNFDVSDTSYASRAYQLLQTGRKRSTPELCDIQASILAIIYFLASDRVERLASRLFYFIFLLLSGRYRENFLVRN